MCLWERKIIRVQIPIGWRASGHEVIACGCCLLWKLSTNEVIGISVTPNVIRNWIHTYPLSKCSVRGYKEVFCFSHLLIKTFSHQHNWTAVGTRNLPIQYLIRLLAIHIHYLAQWSLLTINRTSTHVPLRVLYKTTRMKKTWGVTCRRRRCYSKQPVKSSEAVGWREIPFWSATPCA